MTALQEKKKKKKYSDVYIYIYIYSMMITIWSAVAVHLPFFTLLLHCLSFLLLPNQTKEYENPSSNIICNYICVQKTKPCFLQTLLRREKRKGQGHLKGVKKKKKKTYAPFLLYFSEAKTKEEQNF